MTTSDRHALLDIVLDKATLTAALRRVRRNKGAPGCDGQTIDAFRADADTAFDRLAAEVRSGTYRPVRLRNVRIAKPGGGQRRLRIPAVRDRVLQTAVLQVLTPLIDPSFHEASFAYRPGRGVPHALARLEQMALGERWLVDLDIADFFDSVEHALLRSDIAARIADASLYRLFLVWLRAFSRRGRGIAQGSPVSPFLSNLFLHPVDLQLEAAGIGFVRYADDILLVSDTRRSALAARRALTRLLSERRLSVNASKSAVLAPGQAHVYLGRMFGSSARDRESKWAA